MKKRGNTLSSLFVARLLSDCFGFKTVSHFLRFRILYHKIMFKSLFFFFLAESKLSPVLSGNSDQSKIKKSQRRNVPNVPNDIQNAGAIVYQIPTLQRQNFREFPRGSTLPEIYLVTNAGIHFFFLKKGNCDFSRPFFSVSGCY